MNSQLDSPIGFAKHFIWREALWLPRWAVYAVPLTEEIEFNIRRTAEKMDLIRDIFKKSITVTSFYRPEIYNQLIGGAQKSAHVDGLACDFIVTGVQSSKAREILKPKLKDIGIRMEALGTPHVHIDLKCDESMSLSKRYFMP